MNSLKDEVLSMDEDDEFYDTISVSSQATLQAKRRSYNNKDYISLSRNTVYHSTIDLDNMELNTLSNGDSHQQQVARSHVITYKQWRERNWNKNRPDFVLAYSSKTQSEKRNVFKKNLEEVGLELFEDKTQETHFLLVHVPEMVLQQYAEILKLRMPLKLQPHIHEPNILERTTKRILNSCNVYLDPKIFPEREYQLTAEFSRDKLEMFDETSPDYFNSSSRITVASYILERESYGTDPNDKGIKKLLAEKIYKAAYPLHDGSLTDEDTMSTRRKLLEEWASVSKWIKHQPLDDIKDYFGVQIALYYAWLGFYTHMLIPAALVGFCCFLYGVITLNQDIVSKDVCSLNVTMCPQCDKYCPFWELQDTCVYSKISYLVDNPSTLFFSVFMSIWAAVYLEYWKRYSAGIAHRWGMSSFDVQCEHPRPEYLTRLSKSSKAKIKINFVTSTNEPVVPFWRYKCPTLLVSYSVIILMLAVVVAVVFGIVIYRMSLLSSNAIYADSANFRNYVLPITAGLINLICIIILNNVYHKLAYYLNELELHRTQTEFDDQLTLKIYLFQFVNYYTSIFYIAFIKGKLVGYPAKYNRIFGLRQEECQPGGCLVELTIQLAIIMVGNQALNSLLEILIPFLTKMFKIVVNRRGKDTANIVPHNQWTSDLTLLDMEPQGLFNEYLEMVLQYGFVTIFVTAFPLAPLFALLNNIFELRLDAKKMLRFYRRPVPKRVKDIGVWINILNLLCRISIVTNGLILALSSQFIPKLMYTYQFNRETHNLQGFLEFTLTAFKTADFQMQPEENPNNVTVCSFNEFRNSYMHEMKYKRRLEYWHISAARFIFVVVYQNLVGLIITFIQFIIPDIPSKLQEQIQRENYEINENIIEKEKQARKSLIPRLSNTEKLSFIDENLEYGDQNGGLHRRNVNNSGDQDVTNF